jgi:hypothetical protein
MKPRARAVCIIMTIILLSPIVAYGDTPEGTAFTYQGMLKKAGTPLTASADLLFSLWDAVTGGSQIGPTLGVTGVAVQSGLFTANLDFGTLAFNGSARWLQVAVRSPSGNGVYVTVTPRQPLNAAPYAAYALHSPGSGLWAGSGTGIYNTNSGHVGIGTTTPLAPFHIQAEELSLLSTVIYGDDLVIEASDAVLGLYSSGGGTYGSAIGLSETSAGALVDKWSFFRTTNAANPSSQLRFSYGTNTNYDANPTLFALGSDGSLGLGTTTPTAKLDVEGGGLHVSGASSIYGDFQVGTSGNIDNAAKVNVLGGSDTDLSGGGYLVLGSITGANLSIDNNELQARSNGAAAALYLNYQGGDVHLGGATTVVGNLTVRSASSNNVLVELGEGLDYAEGFSTSEREKSATPAGSVMVIDVQHPGQLTLSKRAYDTRVAGIVAGANGLGSAVRLGAGRFDVDVALAGRVYCFVDATEIGIEPGDLLTTSATPGHAMKVADPQRASGAILGKAMEPLKEGEKGQILVLVTLQ